MNDEPYVGLDDIRAVSTVDDLAEVLRRLRRREARSRRASPLSYRELAARTGWAHGIIGDYFSGQALAPTDRFDILVGLLGASAQEVGALATARDRVEENRRRSRTRPAPPRQLPAAPTPFVGREDLLASLHRQSRLIALCGTAGVGKTALGLHFAHRAGSRYPDGSLYVDLRGFGPDQPASTSEVLSRFLRSMGVAGAELAVDPAQLATQFRSLIAERRMIVFLDNAQSAQQVRPLLTGDPASLTIVTSRDSLAGLVARDGAARVDVGLLSDQDAVSLLRRLVGQRVDDEPAAAQSLVARCAYLPLAVRVAAELAARRSWSTLGALVDELAERTLDLLEAGGDPETAVRPILSWSYQSLSPDAARCLRALGLFHCADLEHAAISALAGAPVADTVLDELVETHLVEARGNGRYGMHDLLHAFAAEQVAADPQQPGGPALERLEQYYLDGCRQAIQVLYPAEAGHAVSPRFDLQTALQWLDTELANLLALSRQGVGGGRLRFAVALSGTLWNYLDRSARYQEAMEIHGNAVSAARAGNDRRGEAAALGELGQVLCRQSRYPEALEQLRLALELSRETGDPARQATTLNSMSIAYSRLGDTEQALEHLRLALQSHRSQGNRVGEGKVLSNLGIEYAQLGRYTAANEHFEQALAIARSLDDRYGLANALNNLGLVTCWLGRYPESIAYYTEGLTCARQAGDRAGEGRLLANLGVDHTRLGSFAEAQTLLDQALTIHREVGDRAAEAEGLSYLGDLCQATGDYPAALAHHEQALAVAVEIGYRHIQGPAHLGAGLALRHLGDPGQAASRMATALSIAREIGDRLQEANVLSAVGDPATAQQAKAIYAALGVPV